MEDGESKSHIHDNSYKSWANSHVESHESISFVDLRGAIGKAVVLSGFKSLHLGLHDIDWVVKHS